MDRRAGVVLGCAVVLVTAGCSGPLTSTELATFSANETVVSESALSETDYRAAGNVTINQTFNASAVAVERRVAVVSHVHSYNRSVDPSVLEEEAGPDDPSASVGIANATAQFVVVATPDATVGNRSVNPVTSLPVEVLVDRFLAAGGNRTLRFEGNRTATALGAERTISTYRTGVGATDAPGTDTDTATRPGVADALDLVVHVGTFEYRGDVVIVVASHPAVLDERSRIDSLLAGLERVPEAASESGVRVSVAS